MSAQATRLRKAMIEHVLEVPARTSREARRAAFDNAGVPAPAAALVDKVVRTAWQISDDDIAAARKAGLSEDEIFELVVCGALGEASRQLAAGLAALEAATAPGGDA